MRARLGDKSAAKSGTAEQKVSVAHAVLFGPERAQAVHRTAEARSGQIVVARMEDEVTVKRLQRRGSRVELIAENPDYTPIVVNGPLTIEGLMVGLIWGGRVL